MNGTSWFDKQRQQATPEGNWFAQQRGAPPSTPSVAPEVVPPEKPPGYLQQMGTWAKDVWQTLVADPAEAWKRGDLPGMVAPITGAAEALAGQYGVHGSVWQQPLLSTRQIFEAIPWFGPQLNAAVDAQQRGDPTTASAIYTQIGIQLAAAKVAPKVKAAARQLLDKPPMMPAELQAEISKTVTPLAPEAPPELPGMGRRIQAAIAPAARAEEQAAAGAEELTAARQAAAKGTAALEKVKAGAETVAAKESYTRLRERIAARQHELEAQSEATARAQERSSMGLAADVFGPEQTHEALGTGLAAARESRIKSVRAREGRAWERLYAIAESPENTREFGFDEVYERKPGLGEATDLATGKPSKIVVEGPVDLGKATAAIKANKPLWRRLEGVKQLIPAAQRELSPAYSAIKDITGGRKIVSLREARAAMSALWQMGYTEFPEMKNVSQGLASAVEPYLYKTIEDSIGEFVGADEALSAHRRAGAYTALRHEVFERGPGGVAIRTAEQAARGNVEGMVLSRTPRWQDVSSLIAQTGKAQLPSVRRRVIQTMLDRADYDPEKFSTLARSMQPEVRGRVFTPEQSALIDRMGVQVPRAEVPGMQQPMGPAKYAPGAAPPETVSYAHLTNPDVQALAGLLGKEPLGVVARFIKEGDGGIEALHSLQRIAPTTVPELARAVADGILQKGNAQDWMRLGPETKDLLYGSLRPELDDLFTQLGRATGPKRNMLTEAIKMAFVYHRLPFGVHLRVGGPGLLRLLSEEGGRPPTRPPEFP